MLNKTERKQLIEVWDVVWNRYQRVGWLGLSEAEQNFYDAWHFVSEVNHGGFEYYYFNSGGYHALYAAEALRSIRAPKHAAILQEANVKFPDGLPPEDIDERQDRMNAFGDDIYTLWAKQDEKVYSITEKFEELVWDYYRNNVENINSS